MPTKLVTKERTLALICAAAQRHGFSREPTTLDTTCVILRKGPVCVTVRTGRTFGSGSITWSVDATVTPEQGRRWMDSLDRKLFGSMGYRLISKPELQLRILEEQLTRAPSFEVEHAA